MSRWTEALLVSAGGVLGVNARHWMALAIARVSGDRFPWATFAINVSGAFAIGALATLIGRGHPARLFALVGFLGGYTTFSSFALEGHTLWARGETARALGYLGGSVAAGFVAVTLGVVVGRALIGPEVPAATLAAAEDISGVDE